MQIRPGRIAAVNQSIAYVSYTDVMLTKEPESMLGGAVRLIETATAERFVPGAAVGVVNSAGRTAIAVAGAAQWTPQPVDLTAEM